MFLITFVTLVISIIGLYAQVLSLQASKIYKAQNGLMQTMVTWHNSAVGLAKSQTITNLTATTPCIIPSDFMVGKTFTNAPAYPACVGSTGPLILTAANPTPTLPTGYKTANFSFYSVVFQNASTNYLITYAYYTDAASYAPTGNLYLPDVGGASVGYSLTSLTQQFARTASEGTIYGSVLSPDILSVPPKTIGVTGPMIQYTIPPVIPTGSLAVISPLS